jgi:gamma-glutamylcyclotransferase (GGCT)/AIG2-like uncharacterized protein YtfP
MLTPIEISQLNRTLYFAYGSNMDPAQMEKRCPGADYFSIGMLPEHRLAFTRYSTNRGCGVADAIRHKRGKVWGVVFSITPKDLARLDDNEGYRADRPPEKNSYNRKRCKVWRDGNEDDGLDVWIYFAVRQPGAPRPNAPYKQHLTDGAKTDRWQLPAWYRAKLKRIRIQ